MFRDGFSVSLLIPEENAKDLVEIADSIKSGLEIVPVSRMDEVLARAMTRKPEPIEWDETTITAAAEEAPVEEKATEPARGGAGYRLEPHSPTKSEAVMARCDTCGNDYDKAFQVSMNGTTHTFDSFECAIHALAPTCDNCGIHILGHGLEKEGTFFCCDHCAEAKGVIGLRDRIGAGGVIEMGSRA